MKTLGDRIADQVSERFPCDDFDLRVREGLTRGATSPAPEQHQPQARIDQRVRALEQQLAALQSEIASSAREVFLGMVEDLMDQVHCSVGLMISKNHNKVDESIRRVHDQIYNHVSQQLAEMRTAIKDGIDGTASKGSGKAAFKFAGEDRAARHDVRRDAVDGEILPPVPRSLTTH